MACDPLEPQVVSQSRRVANHRGFYRRSRPRLPDPIGQPRRHQAQVSCGPQGKRGREKAKGWQEGLTGQAPPDSSRARELRLLRDPFWTAQTKQSMPGRLPKGREGWGFFWTEARC